MPPRIFALSRLAVMPSSGPADVSSFLPLLNTDRGRDAEMTSQSFNFGFIDAANFGLREEMHLGR
jgi:hypothetical protein